MINKKINQNNQEPSHNLITELRRDLITNSWISIAPKRSKRPTRYKLKGGKKLDTLKKSCPFENPQATGHGEPVLLYKNKPALRPARTKSDAGGKYKDLSRRRQSEADWSLQIIKNKFPIFHHASKCPISTNHGPYETTEGSGKHEIIITRDHNKHIPLLSQSEVLQVVKAYKERFNTLKKDKCTHYISIFHNHGAEAGATVYHPHSQLVAMPVVPSDVQRSLSGSRKYQNSNKKCAHCTILSWEKKEKSRILFENKDFIAFSPYASRVNFEIEIFPKKHNPYFENTPDKSLPQLAELLKKSLHALYKTLGNPSYNFFIHTAPADGKDYSYYHWHLEIFPKTNTWAGIELGTGMEILMISPEEASRLLKENY